MMAGVVQEGLGGSHGIHRGNHPPHERFCDPARFAHWDSPRGALRSAWWVERSARGGTDAVRPASGGGRSFGVPHVVQPRTACIAGFALHRSSDGVGTNPVGAAPRLGRHVVGV